MRADSELVIGFSGRNNVRAHMDSHGVPLGYRYCVEWRTGSGAAPRLRPAIARELDERRRRVLLCRVPHAELFKRPEFGMHAQH